VPQNYQIVLDITYNSGLIRSVLTKEAPVFARIKKSGKYSYLQIVENRKENGKVKQHVISTIGRLDELYSKDRVETLIQSLTKFSERSLLILSEKSNVSTEALKVGPALIFERLWKETGIKEAINKELSDRRFEFDVERAIFLTVLHRLIVSGSDRFCEKWRREYLIKGVENIQLHHLYRAMAFLGEELDDQKDALSLTPRCTKDLIEENIFFKKRDMFTNLDLVFFDTTSIYFEGQGGETIGRKGYSKDHRSDLNQMIIGAVIDDNGRPLSCEMWPGNTADVNTLIPVVDKVRKRFGIGGFCIVADRGMISADTTKELNKSKIPYILGARMRKVNAIKIDVLSRAGRYTEVHPEGVPKKDPSPLKVKQVYHNGQRYIVCLNTRQARKDEQDREAIISSLEEQIKKGAKNLVGNKGFRKYLKITKKSVSIDLDKVQNESRFDGKWVLQTNTSLSAEQVALKYKELWQVERVFRDVKSLLETRPVYHQCDSTIRGHVFCSFLALILKKELDKRLNHMGYTFEWSDIIQDLKALQEISVKEGDKHFSIRTECKGNCGKIFQAVGVALPPSIRSLS